MCMACVRNRCFRGAGAKNAHQRISDDLQGRRRRKICVYRALLRPFGGLRKHSTISQKRRKSVSAIGAPGKTASKRLVGMAQRRFLLSQRTHGDKAYKIIADVDVLTPYAAAVIRELDSLRQFPQGVRRQLIHIHIFRFRLQCVLTFSSLVDCVVEYFCLGQHPGNLAGPTAIHMQGEDTPDHLRRLAVNRPFLLISS